MFLGRPLYNQNTKRAGWGKNFSFFSSGYFPHKTIDVWVGKELVDPLAELLSKRGIITIASLTDGEPVFVHTSLVNSFLVPCFPLLSSSYNWKIVLDI